MVEDGKIKIDKFDGHDFKQALGAVRLSLAKNVAYNVVSEKTTYDLFKALSNMLMSVDIKFDDEVQALLLPSSLSESWKTSGEFSKSFLSAEDKGRGRKQDRSGYQQKDRKPSQNDKTEHGMEKTVQNQGQSPKMPKSESILKNQQSNRSRN
ncbi:hypothetical protein Tco_0078635 [Tanacetum coccineum]